MKCFFCFCFYIVVFSLSLAEKEMCCVHFLLGYRQWENWRGHSTELHQNHCRILMKVREKQDISIFCTWFFPIVLFTCRVYNGSSTWKCFGAIYRSPVLQICIKYMPWIEYSDIVLVILCTAATNIIPEQTNPIALYVESCC